MSPAGCSAAAAGGSHGFQRGEAARGAPQAALPPTGLTWLPVVFQEEVVEHGWKAGSHAVEGLAQRSVPTAARRHHLRVALREGGGVSRSPGTRPQPTRPAAPVRAAAQCRRRLLCGTCAGPCGDRRAAATHLRVGQTVAAVARVRAGCAALADQVLCQRDGVVHPLQQAGRRAERHDLVGADAQATHRGVAAARGCRGAGEAQGGARTRVPGGQGRRREVLVRGWSLQHVRPLHCLRAPMAGHSNAVHPQSLLPL